VFGTDQSPGAPAVDELDDGLPVEGEIFTEQDLAESCADFMELNTPDGVDQEWLLKKLWEDLRRGEHAEAVLAEAEMARVIEMNQRLDTRPIDGMGVTVARIPLRVFNHWVARYGEDFFRQKDSIDFLLKRAGGGRGNPGFVVETTFKPQVMIDGFRGSAAAPANSPAQREDAPGVLCERHEVKPAAAVGAAAVPPFAKASGGTASRKRSSRGGRWNS
jgi:hypothetical protein